MLRRALLSVVAVIAGLLVSASRVDAQYNTLSQSVTVDRAAGDATFTIDFGHVPNFYSLNSQGLAPDTFEYEIAANPSGSNPLANPTTIIWGNDIHSTGAITFRNASPPDFSDPHSGGWGTVRGSVPFTVKGDDLSFTAPLSLLNTPSGNFSYLAFTQSYNTATSYASGQSVPLPPAIWIGLIMLGVVGLVGFGKNRIRAGR